MISPLTGHDCTVCHKSGDCIIEDVVGHYDTYEHDSDTLIEKSGIYIRTVLHSFVEGLDDVDTNILSKTPPPKFIALLTRSICIAIEYGYMKGRLAQQVPEVFHPALDGQ